MSVNSGRISEQTRATCGPEDFLPIEGVPRFCVCGHRVSLRTSRSEINPGRKYYGCDLAYIRKIYDRSHYFIWFDAAIVQAITIISAKNNGNQKEVSDLNASFSKLKERIDRQSDIGAAPMPYPKVTVLLMFLIAYLLVLLTTST